MNNSKMIAVKIVRPGGPEVLVLDKVEKPKPGPHQVLVKIMATALNRADLMQRKGLYPPPPGTTAIPGLEFAGTIESTGSQVNQWVKGDRVFGLLSGGGYAQYTVTHQSLLMKIPGQMSFQEAAAIPEAFLTAFQAVAYLLQLQKDESILIHAGGSGVGTAAIQLSKAFGASKIVITASHAKHQVCTGLGADLVINYKTQDFSKIIAEYTEDKGVNGIIDVVGAPYFQKNLDCLSLDGRMVLLATMGGKMVESFDLLQMMVKRIHLLTSTLRSRSLDYKARLSRDFFQFAAPRLENQTIQPIIDSVFSYKQVSEAHRYMEGNKNTGKIVLSIDHEAV